MPSEADGLQKCVYFRFEILRSIRTCDYTWSLLNRELFDMIRFASAAKRRESLNASEGVGPEEFSCERAGIRGDAIPAHAHRPRTCFRSPRRTVTHEVGIESVIGSHVHSDVGGGEFVHKSKSFFVWESFPLGFSSASLLPALWKLKSILAYFFISFTFFTQISLPVQQPQPFHV